MVVISDPVIAELSVWSTTSFNPLLKTSARDKVLKMERIQHLKTSLGIKDPIYIAPINKSVFQA